MRIVMLEPLGVNEESVMKWVNSFQAMGHELVPCFSKIDSEQEKIEKVKEADVLVIANSPVNETVINAAQNLKMITVAFTGVDHVPYQLCKDRGIIICNAQGYCTDAVAELVFGLIINKLRNIVPCNDATRKGQTKDGLVGNELLGKTIGIIGTGAIGRRVAEIAKVFHCRILGYDAYPSQEAKGLGVEYRALDELLANSDIVTLHTPLLAETKGLINKEKLQLMKPTALLINCARGPIVDSEALADALNSGQIAGAGIDVYEIEPPINRDHPLVTSKHTIVTPHIAFATEESILRRADITFDNILAWMDGKPVNVA